MLKVHFAAHGSGQFRLFRLVRHFLAAEEVEDPVCEADAVCRFVMPCAIWVSGEVNRRTYRMNETITPISMIPWIAENRAEHAHGDIGQVADDIHERAA